MRRCPILFIAISFPPILFLAKVTAAKGEERGIFTLGIPFTLALDFGAAEKFLAPHLLSPFPEAPPSSSLSTLLSPYLPAGSL